jgi:hypothetical protein
LFSRKRVNYTAEERRDLMEILSRYPMLTGKATDNKVIAVKRSAWEKVTKEFNSIDGHLIEVFLSHSKYLNTYSLVGTSYSVIIFFYYRGQQINSKNFGKIRKTSIRKNSFKPKRKFVVQVVVHIVLKLLMKILILNFLWTL